MMKKKVIVVEDDSDTFDMIKHLIAQLGHEVISVSNILEFGKITFHQPDLLLIDDWHQNSAGHRLCQEVRSNSLTSHIPIILISTNPRITDMSRLYKANDYLPKPFNIEELIAKVRFWLAHGNFRAN